MPRKKKLESLLDDKKVEVKPKKGRRPPERDDPFDTVMKKAEAAKPTQNKPQFHWQKSAIKATDLMCEDVAETQRISTGNFALDVATYGGIPKGTVVRFYGGEKSCKTGSCYRIAAEWQKNCHRCFIRDCGCPPESRKPAGLTWVDAEGKTAKEVNMQRMIDHGIDVSRVNLLLPVNGDEVVDCIDDHIKEGVGLIILDSFAHIVPDAEIKKSVLDNEKIAAQAKIIARACRKWVSSINTHRDGGQFKPTVVGINQLRTGGLGSPTGRTYDMQVGGKALNYATNMDVKFRSHQKSDAGWFVMSEAGNKKYTSDWKEVVKIIGKNEHILLGDKTPDFINVHYDVTNSSQSKAGRSGTFRYWINAVDGHRHGDVDNADTIFRYLSAYKWLHKTNKGYDVLIPDEEMERWGYEDKLLFSARTQKGLEDILAADETVLRKCWTALLNFLLRR